MSDLIFWEHSRHKLEVPLVQALEQRRYAAWQCRKASGQWRHCYTLEQSLDLELTVFQLSVGVEDVWLFGAQRSQDVHELLNVLGVNVAGEVSTT